MGSNSSTTGKTKEAPPVLGRMQMGVTNGHRNPSLKDFQRTVLIRICTD